MLYQLLLRMDNKDVEPSQSTDFIPRPYQIELFEQCYKQNSIIYLPTGTGKTFIAVLLIKTMSSDLVKYVFSTLDFFFYENLQFLQQIN